MIFLLPVYPIRYVILAEEYTGKDHRSMNNLSRAAILVALIQILSKLLGFLREIFLASRFGTSYIVDAYLVCITLPEVLFSIFVGGFSESYIAGHARLHDTFQRNKYFNNTATILFLWGTIIAVFSFFSSKWLSLILAPGFDAPTAEMLICFLRIISVNLPVMAVFSILSAQLQTKERFTVVYFFNFIVTNILILLSIQVSNSSTPNRLVVGYVCAHVIDLVGLWIYAAHKKLIVYRPCFDFRDQSFRNLFKLALPLGASLMVNQLNGVIDRIFCSLLGEGVTSAMSYANKVQLLCYTLTTSIFISVCYPRINRHFADGNKESGMNYIRQAVLVALYISLPVMGGLILFSKPIIALLFERGMFTADSTALTAECLSFYAIGIPFYALREIGTRALSASLQQKRILKNTLLSVVCNLFFNALLLRPLGHIGLALATSLSGMVTFLLILSDMRKLGLRLFTRAQLCDMGKIAASSVISLLVCAVCCHVLLRVLGASLAILIGICFAGCTYLALSILLRMDIVIWIYQRLPARVRIIPWLNRRQISEDR